MTELILVDRNRQLPGVGGQAVMAVSELPALANGNALAEFIVAAVYEWLRRCLCCF